MDARLCSINRHIKNYDRELYANKTNTGVYSLYRKGYRWDEFSYEGKRLFVLRPNPQFIFALTDSWRVSGKPVEWGIEPILHQLREWDNWRDDTQFDHMKKNRERQDELQQRRDRNELRSRAYDMRKEFARATNDINTSTLEKIDRRRLKDGNCKS